MHARANEHLWVGDGCMTHDTSACQRRDTLARALDETEYDRVTAGYVTSTFCDVKVALSMIPAEGRHVWQLGCVKEGRGGESNDARHAVGLHTQGKMMYSKVASTGIGCTTPRESGPQGA